MSIVLHTPAGGGVSSSRVWAPFPRPGGGCLHSRKRSGPADLHRAFRPLRHTTDRTHVAGQVPTEPGPADSGRARWNRLSNAERFALFSALEAVDQAGLAIPIASAGSVLRKQHGGDVRDRALLRGARPESSEPPTADASGVASLNGPAETVARHFGIEGPVETVSSACASGGLAIEQALRALRAGEVDLAFAGGADCLCRTTYSGFNSLRAVDERPCRPFRADRAGMSLGEGRGDARARDARACPRPRRPGARRILGAGSSCDANHMTAPHADGSLGGARDRARARGRRRRARGGRSDQCPRHGHSAQ